MKNTMDHLRNIWQKQNPEISQAACDKLISKLQRLEKAGKKKTILKTVIVFMAVILLSLQLFFAAGVSVWQVTAILIIGASTILTIRKYWEIQLDLKKMDLFNSTTTLVGNAIEKLNDQKKFFKSYFPVYVLALIAALNISLYDYTVKTSGAPKLVYHVIVTVMLSLGALLGTVIRRKIFIKEHQTLLDELQSFKNNAGE